LYALLTGNLPFDDENIRKLLQKVKSGVYVIPDSVPKDAADLIRKMLVINPVKRITIKEIEQHPWFNKLPYNSKLSGDSPLRTPPSPESIKPFKPEDIPSLDLEILNSLNILGYGTEEEIIRALMETTPNYEKVFYWVLKQRKNEILENYDPDQEWINSEGKSLRRRIGSQSSNSSLANDRASLYHSIYMSSPELPSPTKSPPDSPSSDGSKNSTTSPKKNSTSEGQTPESQKKSSADVSKRKSYNPSPLSASVPTEDEEFKPELVAKAKQAALLALEGQRPPTTDVQYESLFSSPPPPAALDQKNLQSKRTSLVDQFKNKVQIQPAQPSTDSDPYQSLSALNHGNDKRQSSKATVDLNSTQNDMGTPKFHRKQLDLTIDVSGLPNKNANMNVTASSPSVFRGETGNASPTTSVVPKKSWFANLFSFKPESFSLSTSGNPNEIKQKIEKILKKDNIDYQPSKDGAAIKCKYDDNGQSQGVKFRISIIAGENGKIEITCTQQQGMF
jgi:hypothetical protein